MNALNAGRTARAACATLVLVTLGGCAGLESRNPLECAGPGVCKISVQVADCTIKVDPPDLRVRNGPHEIQWWIDTDGYEFTDDGITFKSSNDQFSDPRRTGNNKMYHWNDRNSDMNTYRYTVRVQRSGGGTCPSLDPSIINRG